MYWQAVQSYWELIVLSDGAKVNWDQLWQVLIVDLDWSEMLILGPKVNSGQLHPVVLTNNKYLLFKAPGLKPKDSKDLRPDKVKLKEGFGIITSQRT